MTTVAVVIAAALGIVAVLFVARPFLRGAPAALEQDADGELTAEELERLRLVEARDRALAALKELEFDHRTGKISDAEYHELVGSLRREAAEALRALDPVARTQAASSESATAGGEAGQEGAR